MQGIDFRRKKTAGRLSFDVLGVELLPAIRMPEGWPGKVWRQRRAALPQGPVPSIP